MSVQESIAAALAQHHSDFFRDGPDSAAFGCPCGWRGQPSDIDTHLAAVAMDAARQAVEALNASGYTTWDQDKHLPEPPWKEDDPAVVAWEKAHGHDVRIKCYPEFGCQLLIDPEDLRDLLTPEGERDA